MKNALVYAAIPIALIAIFFIATGRAENETGPAVIETKIDQGASALDVKVVPLDVLEDSRCPQGVQCIWAGTVRVRALLQSGLGDANQIFELMKPITTEAEQVMLIEVLPQAEAGKTIDLSAYAFRFKIEKRENIAR